MKASALLRESFLDVLNELLLTGNEVGDEALAGSGGRRHVQIAVERDVCVDVFHSES